MRTARQILAQLNSGLHDLDPREVEVLKSQLSPNFFYFLGYKRIFEEARPKEKHPLTERMHLRSDFAWSLENAKPETWGRLPRRWSRPNTELPSLEES